MFIIIIIIIIIFQSLIELTIVCLQADCGCFYREKTPENAKFAIAGAILDARKHQSGASDKATGRWQGEREKNRLPENRLL